MTNDAAIADTLRMMREHGSLKKYEHELIGWNERMDGIQGAVLSVKLKYLDGWNAARRKRISKNTESASGFTIPFRSTCRKRMPICGTRKVTFQSQRSSQQKSSHSPCMRSLQKSRLRKYVRQSRVSF